MFGSESKREQSARGWHLLQGKLRFLQSSLSDETILAPKLMRRHVLQFGIHCASCSHESCGWFEMQKRNWPGPLSSRTDLRRISMTRAATILCVDDKCISLEGLKMLLEEQEYRVLVTTKATEALQLFSSCSVDLVLLDYHMPEMNGDVVAEHMKATKPDIPVVMLSGDDDLPESTLRSVDLFVSKSDSPARLLETIANVLGLYALSSNSELELVARPRPVA